MTFQIGDRVRLTASRLAELSEFEKRLFRKEGLGDILDRKTLIYMGGHREGSRGVLAKVWLPSGAVKEVLLTSLEPARTRNKDR